MNFRKIGCYMVATYTEVGCFVKELSKDVYQYNSNFCAYMGGFRLLYHDEETS
jgi:hypothetical protein